MRIVVTGSSGRIGSAIAEAARRDHAVTGIDRVAGEQTAVVGDIRDRALIDAHVRNADAVIHAAAHHAPHVGVVSDADFVSTNVEATRDLLEACRRHDLRRFVFTSTTSVYGDAMVDPQRAVWVTEAITPVPRDIYDETKLAAETLCRAYADATLRCVVLRMSRCFPEPPRDMAIYRLYRGVDARDVAWAHLAALEADVDDCEILNVSAQTPFRPEDVDALRHDAASVIRRRVPWAEAAFAEAGWELPGIIDRVYVIDRARAVLGYRPVYNFPHVFGRPDSLQ